MSAPVALWITKEFFGMSGSYIVQSENFDSVTGDEFQFFLGFIVYG
jgi:hypothetical protein